MFFPSDEVKDNLQMIFGRSARKCLWDWLLVKQQSAQSRDYWLPVPLCGVTALLAAEPVPAQYISSAGWMRTAHTWHLPRALCKTNTCSSQSAHANCKRQPETKHRNTKTCKKGSVLPCPTSVLGTEQASAQFQKEGKSQTVPIYMSLYIDKRVRQALRQDTDGCPWSW